MIFLFLYFILTSIDTTAFERLPMSSKSSDVLPRCVVKDDVLELYIDHFSWGWLSVLMNRRHVRGKRFGCIPSIPVSLPPEKTPILHAHLYMITRSDPSPVDVSRLKDIIIWKLDQTCSTLLCDSVNYMLSLSRYQDICK